MTSQPTTREEPPDPSADINELCAEARIGAMVMGGWGKNPNVHPIVAYSCRGAEKLITALTDALRRAQRGDPL